MRYKTQEGGIAGGKYSVVDTWYHNEERRSASSIFIVCECSNIDIAEKIAAALNEYDATMGVTNLPKQIEY